MNNSQFESFCNWVRKTIIPRIREEMGIIHIFSAERFDDIGFVINVGSNFTGRTNTHKALAEERKNAGCTILEGTCNRYSLLYDATSQQTLLQEVRAIFPNAEAIRYKSCGESELTAKFRVPYGDAIAFAQKEGIETPETSAKDVTCFLSHMNDSLVQKLKHVCNMDKWTIEIGGGYALIHGFYENLEAYSEEVRTDIQKKIAKCFPDTNLDTLIVHENESQKWDLDVSFLVLIGNISELNM